MEVVIFLIVVLLSAFCSGMEIAYVSADKLRIEIEHKKGGFLSKLVYFLAFRPNHYIATMLLGNNVALVVYGLITSKLLEPYLTNITNNNFGVLIMQTLISTIFILFAGEYLPKKFFMTNPNRKLQIFIFPVYLIYIIFFPITVFIIKFSDIVLKIIFKAKITENERKNVFNKIDLNNFINNANENVKNIDEEFKIIQNTLDFDKTKLKECIVPRNEIVALEKNATIQELTKTFIDTNFSKILVYDGSIDNIIGYVHSYGLYNSPKNIREIIVDMPIVPETMAAQKLFNILLKRNRSLALVVDEYGGTSGIVSIEDLLEEIFGEINDEHDTDDLAFNKINDKEYEFSGRIEIDKINEQFDLNIPNSEDYETITGYIIEKLERFPEKGEIVEIDNFEIHILEAEQPRINLVRLIIISKN